jgi:glycosyltransferase involved in cell wall biosynthesis
MAEPKVSVIIPVYNVEKDLLECLTSVSNQTFHDIEVIVINDGSTDSSYKIVEEFIQKDQRFSLYDQENIGLGETRNRGISLAKGLYLAFVDSDDFLDTDYIEKLYNKAVETGADVVHGEVLQFFEDTDRTELEHDLSQMRGIQLDSGNAAEFYRNVFFTHIFRHYAWNKLYRASFVKQHEIRFGDNKRIFAEDTWFQLQLLHYLPHIEYVSGSTYHYRQRAASIMHKPKKDLLRRQSMMVADYWRLIRGGDNFDLESKVCGLIAMDVFTMEAMNQMKVNGSAKSLYRQLKDIRSFSEMYHCVTDLNRNKTYELEANNNRRTYLRVVSTLYRRHMDKLAADFIWLVYKKLK